MALVLMTMIFLIAVANLWSRKAAAWIGTIILGCFILAHL